MALAAMGQGFAVAGGSGHGSLPGLCVGVLCIGIAPVDGSEGGGADVKGVARVVVKLQLLCALLLTAAQHLLCQLLDLHVHPLISTNPAVCRVMQRYP